MATKDIVAGWLAEIEILTGSQAAISRMDLWTEKYVAFCMGVRIYKEKTLRGEREDSWRVSPDKGISQHSGVAVVVRRRSHKNPFQCLV